mmetsp:Transcript_43279/g.114470  ORF Transcript_43279/g.114470 Transcript_43279/m.114470 type:complete len:287 (+) Transcript_43279:202-1062(+)
MPVRRSNRIHHHLAVHGTAHIVGAIHHRSRLDADLALRLLLLLLLLLLLQGRQVAEEGRAILHRCRHRGGSLGHLGRVEGLGGYHAGRDHLHLVALDVALQLGGLSAVRHQKRCAGQRVAGVLGSPVLQGGPLKHVAIRSRHWVVHERACELAGGPGRDSGLVGHAQGPFPTVRGNEGRHVFVVRVILVLAIVGRRRRGTILALALLPRLHGEEPLPLLGLVLCVAPPVLLVRSSGLHGRRVLLVRRPQHGELQRLDRLERRLGEGQPHALLRRQASLQALLLLGR